MSFVEVKFTPTKAMPIYQGTCRVVDQATGKESKPLLIIKEAGTYHLPRDKAAQVCADFPENFSSKESLDWTDRQLAGGTIFLTPGEGIPGAATSAKVAKAPTKTA